MMPVGCRKEAVALTLQGLASYGPLKLISFERHKIPHPEQRKHAEVLRVRLSRA